MKGLLVLILRILFDEVFAKRITRGARGNNTGLQCSVNSANSPVKAWRLIFTHSILDTIVDQTNEYGEVRCNAVMVLVH